MGPPSRSPPRGSTARHVPSLAESWRFRALTLQRRYEDGMRYAFLLVNTFVTLGVCGCATFSADRGFTPVAEAAQRHLRQEIIWPRDAAEQAKADAQGAELLRSPLSAEDAVQVALLNNRALQGDFEELGISESDLVQAGRRQNTRFALRHASAAGQYDVEET